MFKTQWNEAYYKPTRPTKKRGGKRRLSANTTLRVLGCVTGEWQVAKEVAEKASIADCSVRPHLYILRDRGLVTADLHVGKPTQWRLK